MTINKPIPENKNDVSLHFIGNINQKISKRSRKAEAVLGALDHDGKQTSVPAFRNTRTENEE